MTYEVDISENALYQRYGEKVCMNLLQDHTTQRNIYWATDSYADTWGEGYTFHDPITIEKITGERGNVIQPRVVKSRQNQTERTKQRAEVFTPSWICNAQNNLIDEAWFGRKDVFNTEHPDSHTWTPTEEKIAFPDGKTWQDYVREPRLEISCGEAPYLVSRYDTVTGQPIADLRQRIGLLDRKLRVVGENTSESAEWLRWARQALKATYGFEWQGDNLLLAREALLQTFIEYYEHKFGHRPKINSVLSAANIISWNLWQMDGLTFGLPGKRVTEQTPEEAGLFYNAADVPPDQRLCRVAEWKDDRKPKMKEIVFKQIVMNNKH